MLVSANGESLLRNVADRTVLLETMDYIGYITRDLPCQIEAEIRRSGEEGADDAAQASAQAGGVSEDIKGQALRWVPSDKEALEEREALCMMLMEANRYAAALEHLQVLLRCNTSRNFVRPDQTPAESQGKGVEEGMGGGNGVASEERDVMQEEVGGKVAGSEVAGSEGDAEREDPRVVLFRVWEAIGLCLLNTYQHSSASKVFDVCLFLSRGSTAGACTLLSLFLFLLFFVVFFFCICFFFSLPDANTDTRTHMGRHAKIVRSVTRAPNPRPDPRPRGLLGPYWLQLRFVATPRMGDGAGDCGCSKCGGGESGFQSCRRCRTGSDCAEGWRWRKGGSGVGRYNDDGRARS